MAHTFVSLGVHLVWSPKRRQALLSPHWRHRLFRYMAGVARNKGARILAAGGVEDHIHLYVSMSARLSVSALVNALKANSSRWIHETIPGLHWFGWQTGYSAFSVNRRDDAALIRYILSQEAHHARRWEVRRSDTQGELPRP